MRKNKRKIFLSATVSILFYGFAISQNSPESKQITHDLVSSGFQLSIGPSVFFHLKDKDRENPNIPDEFESLEERPSVRAFYNNNVGIKSAISYFFHEKLFDINAGIGLQYEFHYLDAKSDYNVDAILGERLYLHMLVPYIDLINFYSSNSYSINYRLGPSFRRYYGRSNTGPYEIRNNYLGSIGLRMEATGSLNNISRRIPVFISVNMGMDLGTIIRDDVEFYSEGKRIGRAEITGADSMRDFLLFISFQIGYRF